MRRALGIIRQCRRCESGSTAIEFGLIGTVMIMSIFGVIEFGRGFYFYNKLSYAADLAARKVLVKPDVTDQALEDEIDAVFSGEPPSPIVTVTVESSGTGSSAVTFKVVEIAKAFEPLVPKLITDKINLRTVRRIPVLP